MLDCGGAALNDAGPISEADAHGAGGLRRALGGVGRGPVALQCARGGAGRTADLAAALKLPRYDLYGGSYGTRIAFAVLTHAPRGVRAVVLDSVWPPEAKWAEGGPQMISSAVKVLFDRCGADAACHAAFPDPAAKLDALSRKLLSGPMTVGRRTYTADDLGGFLMDQVYTSDGAREPAARRGRLRRAATSRR